MTCFHPLELYRQKDGRLAGSKPAGQVPRPVTVACRHCRGCRLEHSRQWAVRCVHEAKMHDANCFITLTYNDKHLPADLSLRVEHWQHFAKRLRQSLTRRYKANCRALDIAKPFPPYKPFRFFMCGEYGEGKGTRPINPHYHAILFGEDFLFDRKHHQFTPQGHETFTSDFLTDTWGKGNCEIGSVTHQSAAYVARYCLKKQTAQQQRSQPDTYQGRKHEFATMSRNPGLGKTWIDKFHTDVYPHDIIVAQDGTTSRPPKYYDDQLPAPQLEAIKEARVKQAQNNLANNTPARLAVRETVLNSRLTTLTRTL